ncbi:MAG: universal stress protein [Cyanobacteria bacterium J06621_8]
MIDKIVAAIDYSDHSQSVFESAITMARTHKALLMLLHVVAEGQPIFQLLPSYSYYPMENSHDYGLNQQKLQYFERAGIDFLQTKAKEAEAAGVAAEFTQLAGNPGRSICDLANTWSADLVLVGSRGLNGLKEIFLGSVSNYVTHHAHCPVMVIRPEPDYKSEEVAGLHELKPLES